MKDKRHDEAAGQLSAAVRDFLFSEIRLTIVFSVC
jgi:hypothetical protein